MVLKNSFANDFITRANLGFVAGLGLSAFLQPLASARHAKIKKNR
jgi:hypothetical protein